MRIFQTAIVLAFVLTGCAYVTAVPVKPGDPDPGIRIYDVKPLLVVANTQVSVIMVPNYNRGYAVKFGAFLAKHDFEIDMANGVVSKVTSNQDATALPTELVKVLEEGAKTGKLFAESVTPPAAEQVNGKEKANFQIFEIEFDSSGAITGLKPLLPSESVLIKMPVANQATRDGPPPEPPPASNGKGDDKIPTGAGNKDDKKHKPNGQ